MTLTQQGNPKNLLLKRQLRQSLTPAEAKLWQKLRANQFEELKFRKQHGIGPWIVDFYCPQKKLVIEIDGDIHADAEQKENDEKRAGYLTGLGLEVVRYTNREVLENISGVLEDLYRRVCQGTQGSTSPGPALQRRGG